MTDYVEITNLALQALGTRTTVTALEFANKTTNESIQANLVYTKARDELLRMAPWDCAFIMNQLAYISSVPGTPENTSPATSNWQRGQPYPPWAYEYQYPVDCLRACFVVPQWNTGFSNGIPITTAVTGGAPQFWNGPPVRFKVGTDLFVPVLTATVVVGGGGYAVGDQITLISGDPTLAPIGAPVVLTVLTAPAGVVATVSVNPQISGGIGGGSYFAAQANPVAQGSTTGVGSGATFNLTYGSQGQQRIILTNQELALLAYCKQVVDPNVFDSLFQTAYVHYLASKLIMALTKDKNLANMMLSISNGAITEARKADANEGLTVNDVTPDWIRVRGIAYPNGYDSGPYCGYDFGNLFPLY